MEALKNAVAPLHLPHTLLTSSSSPAKTRFCFNPMDSNRTLASSAYRLQSTLPRSKLWQFGLHLVIPRQRLRRFPLARCNHSNEFPDDCNAEELRMRIAKRVEEMMDGDDDDKELQNLFGYA